MICVEGVEGSVGALPLFFFAMVLHLTQLCGSERGRNTRTLQGGHTVGAESRGSCGVNNIQIDGDKL